jgi:proline-specific peptidase
LACLLKVVKLRSFFDLIQDLSMNTVETHVERGYVSLATGQLYYERHYAGTGIDVPVVVIPGGPGFPHNYLEILSQLVKPGRSVIFYDQLSAGKSKSYIEPRNMELENLLGELEALITFFNLSQFHLFGHSTGGVVAMEYLFRQPQNKVKSLVLESPFPSAQAFKDAKFSLTRTMKPEYQAAVDAYDGLSKPSNDYQMALLAFTSTHVTRVKAPESLKLSLKTMSHVLHETMWGKRDFKPGGKLRHWTTSGRLGLIKLPTLIISGVHDECTPEIVIDLHQGISASQWQILENCAHMAHLEDPAAFMRVVGEFYS